MCISRPSSGCGRAGTPRILLFVKIELTLVSGETETLSVARGVEPEHALGDLRGRSGLYAGGWAPVQVEQGMKYVNLDHVVAIRVTNQ